MLLELLFWTTQRNILYTEYIYPHFSLTTQNVHIDHDSKIFTVDVFHWCFNKIFALGNLALALRLLMMSSSHQFTKPFWWKPQVLWLKSSDCLACSPHIPWCDGWPLCNIEVWSWEQKASIQQRVVFSWLK